jgi:hypothetical protein
VVVNLVSRSASVKAYLIITGSIFGLIALAHLLRTIAERPCLSADPWFYLEGPGLGVVAAAFAYWAWRLLRGPQRPRDTTEAAA